MTETLNFNTLDAEIVRKDEEEGVIKVPISSDSTDRDGDEISERGLRSIVSQIEETGTPIFGNHGMDSSGMFGMGRYDWKDIIATAKDAELTDDNVVLAYLNPNDAHYDGEGELLVDYIEEEQAVGFSIGFRPTESEEKSSGEGNFIYHDMDLMETSAVGIPSNPDGMTTAKSLQDELGISEEEAQKLMQVAQLLSSDMSTKETNMEEDKTIDDVLERLDALESMVETHFSELEARMEGEDDEDEEDDEEEDSEEDKSYTKEEVEELESKIDELRDTMDEDVEDSETKVHGEPGDDANGGWF